jgi:hypothetical protein
MRKAPPNATSPQAGDTATAKVGPKSRRSPSRGSKPGERRGGRQKGTPNKVTGQLKDMILGALENAGGVKYLETQANENPAAFMTLVGKVLPLQVGLDAPEGGAARVVFEVIRPS